MFRPYVHSQSPNILHVHIDIYMLRNGSIIFIDTETGVRKTAVHAACHLIFLYFISLSFIRLGLERAEMRLFRPRREVIKLFNGNNLLR